MRTKRIAVVGAGIGGLAAAIDLATAGCETVVFERQPAPGGKLRQLAIGPHRIDSGPTVLTMRWVFDALFDAAGDDFGARVPLRAAEVLARHAWDDASRLDLHADPAASADAIARFAGRREADGYRALCQRASALFASLERPFLHAARPPGPVGLAFDAGASGVLALLRSSPFRSLWDLLGEHFTDVRLCQLFGRYATYCGASPFAAPATLLLIAHVEQRGVWLVDGGLGRLTDALVALAGRLGVQIRCNEDVTSIDVERGAVAGLHCSTGERFAADAVIANADIAAICSGLLGSAVRGAVAGRIDALPRSLSAITWSCDARAAGFPLDHHNVFFSRDYAREFDELFGRAAVPADPTVYLCAQNRETTSNTGTDVSEPMLILINAPAIGDAADFDDEEIEQCRIRTLNRLSRCGLDLRLDEATCVATTPRDFAGLFPGTGGALYGRATHGWRSAFLRPSAKTTIEGLYVAGGSVHPGPGLPMAMLSGRAAAASLLADRTSRARSPRTAMPGGMSMR